MPSITPHDNRFLTLFYIGMADYGPRIGIGGGTDLVPDIESAADMLVDLEEQTGKNCRIIQVDLDGGTSTDVTLTCRAIARSWKTAREAKQLKEVE